MVQQPPKFDISLYQAIPRDFIGRNDYLNIFRNYRSRPSSKVIMFHGIGGIGKSTLCHQMIKLLNTDKSDNEVWISLSFEDPQLRTQDYFLFSIRQRLGLDWNFQFILFDIAYTLYWKKVYRLDLLPQEMRKLEDTALMKEIYDIIEELPLVRIVRKVYSLAQKMKGFLESWWEKQGHPFLQSFNKLTTAEEMLQYLHIALLLDIEANLQDTKKRFFFFVDTYEALFSDVHISDTLLRPLQKVWFKEIVSKTYRSISWIIFGREPLTWDTYDSVKQLDWTSILEQHEMTTFSEDEVETFLLRSGIKEESLIRHIKKISGGLPLFLDLSKDIYYQLKGRSIEPTLKDFPDNHLKLFQQFIKYLRDINERETLLLLSVPRKWNASICQLLITRFGTGYPFSRFKELTRFSFVIDLLDEHFTFHDVVKTHFQRYLHQRNSNLLQRIHESLAKYYEEQASFQHSSEITPLIVDSIKEIFYHKQETNKLEAIKWLLQQERPLYNACQYGVLNEFSSSFDKEFFNPEIRLKLLELHARTAIKIGLWKELKLILEENLRLPIFLSFKNTGDYLKCLNLLGDIHQYLGNYTEAKIIYNDILSNCEEIKDYNLLSDIFNDLGQIAVIQGDIQNAEEMYNKALDYAKEDKELELINRSLLNLGVLLSNQGHHKEALEHFNNVLETSRKIGDKIHQLHVLKNIARINYEQDEYPKALKDYKRLLKLSQSIGDRKLESDTFFAIGKIHYMQDNEKHAKENYIIALESYKEIGDKFNQAKVLDRIGLLYYIKDDYSTASSYFTEALEVFKELGSKAEITIILNHIGLIYQAQDRYEEAIEYFKQAYQNASELNDLTRQAENLSSIGDIYLAWDRYTEALENYETAYKIYQETEGKKGETYCLEGIGYILHLLNQGDEALKVLYTALEINKDINSKIGEAGVLGAIAMVYRDQGDFRKAQDCINNSRVIYQSLEIPSGITEVQENQALIDLMEGKYEQATQNLQKALKSNQDMSSKSGIMINLRYLGLIMFEHTEDPQQALDLYNQAFEIASEINNKYEQAILLRYKGELFTRLERYQEASECLQQSFEIGETIKLESIKHWANLGIMEVNCKTSNYRRVRKTLEEILHFSKWGKDKELEIEVYIMQGLFYQKTKRYKESIQSIEIALNISKNLGYKYLETRAHVLLGEVYDQLEDRNIALEHFTSAHALSQELGIHSFKQTTKEKLNRLRE